MEHIWNEYNNPPYPQYGIPENQRVPYTGGSQIRSSSSTSRRSQQGSAGGRGLGAALKNHGMIGAVGGLALGAVDAGAYEHHEKEKHRHEDRTYDEGYYGGES